MWRQKQSNTAAQQGQRSSSIGKLASMNTNGTATTSTASAAAVQSSAPSSHLHTFSPTRTSKGIDEHDDENTTNLVLASIPSDVLAASLACVQHAFENFKEDQIGISFNGGKDSVVMLYLVKEVIGPERLKKLKLFMFSESDEFEEMVAFRNELLASWELQLVMMDESLGIKGGLQELYDRQGVRAVFLGTRKDDPDGKYQDDAIQKCSKGWPAVVRYCPVFFWHYKQIWSYTLEFQLPFCILYQEGYTSLGSKLTTQRNPHLGVTGGGAANGTGSSATSPSSSTTTKFLPAWELKDGAWEREGRGRAAAHM